MFQIAIDGPAGSGKSTIAKMLADQLGFIYLSTGKMYRAYAYLMLKNNWSLDDLIANINRFKIVINGDNVKVNDTDISTIIQSSEISELTSNIATNEKLRSIAVKKQQDYAVKNNIVMDGRDIGSVVLPHAQLKFFLTASAKVRAQRRAKQLNLDESNLANLEQSIIVRDLRDMNRLVGPLVKTKDAIEIDTSDLKIGEVLNKMLKICKQKMGV